jgi:hypothetical protein
VTSCSAPPRGGTSGTIAHTEDGEVPVHASRAAHRVDAFAVTRLCFGEIVHATRRGPLHYAALEQTPQMSDSARPTTLRPNYSGERLQSADSPRLFRFGAVSDTSRPETRNSM